MRRRTVGLRGCPAIMDPTVIWTIGHSTLSVEAYMGLLRGQRIELPADVRRYPASKMHPHFNAAVLARSLAKESLRYRAYSDLGGRRSPRTDSPNTRWRSASFRGYADYMETPTSARRWRDWSPMRMRHGRQ